MYYHFLYTIIILMCVIHSQDMWKARFAKYVTLVRKSLVGNQFENRHEWKIIKEGKNQH